MVSYHKKYSYIHWLKKSETVSLIDFYKIDINNCRDSTFVNNVHVNSEADKHDDFKIILQIRTIINIYKKECPITFNVEI